MTAERWAELKSLFDEALALDQGQQEAFLESLRRRDATLEESLRSLIHHHDSAPSLLDGPMISQQRIVEYLTSGFRTFHAGDLAAGRFRIERFIGEGGMGEVYAAKDLDLGEDVALKTLRPCFALNDHLLARFKLEIQTARKVTHPNVCRVFDLFWHRLENETGATTTLAFLTMQLINGKTLEHCIRSEGKFSERQALHIAQQVISGLAAAHRAGIVHRDLKSGNILLAEEGKEQKALITDFGLARWIEKEAQGPTASVEGTPPYLAPEQLAGEKATPASDIYALGVVLFEMLTGRLPFSNNSSFAEAIEERKAPQSPSKYVSGLDRRWETAVLACLQFDPGKRPAGATDVLERISSHRVSRRLWIGAAAGLGGAGLMSRIWLHKPTVNLSAEAVRSFKRGQEFAKRGDSDGLRNAVMEFKRVVSLEPNYVAGWVGLAEVYATLSNFNLAKPYETLLSAREAATRAIALDGSSGKAYGIYAYTLSLDLHNWLTAEPQFQKAVSLDPDDPTIRYWYGALLGKLSRAEDAFGQLRIGLDKDPSSLRLNQQLTAEYFWVRQYDDALKQAREMVRVQPFQTGAHLTLARALEWLQRYDEALKSCDDAERLNASPAYLSCYRGSIEASRGNVAKARGMVESVRHYWVANPFESALLATFYAHLNDAKMACNVLNEGYNRQDSTVLTATCNPFFDSIRGDAGFRAFLRKLGWVQPA